MPSLEEKRNIAERVRYNPNGSFELTLQITDECNLRCSYCYETKKAKRMTKDLAFKIIDKFFPVNKEYFGSYFQSYEGIDNKHNPFDYFVFNFFGGECLLEIDLMWEVVKYFEKKCREDLSKYKKRLNNYKVMFQSNGVLLQEKKVVDFIDYFVDKFNDLGERRLIPFITIDGTKEVHNACRKFKDSEVGSYDIVAKNIKWFMEKYHIEPYSKQTITHATLPHLYESYLSLKEVGFRHIRSTFIEEPNHWQEGDTEIAERELTKIKNDLLRYPNETYYFDTFRFPNANDECVGYGSCGVNGSQLCFDYSGNIFNCFRFTSCSIPEYVRPLYNLGDIDHGIIYEDRIKALRRMMDKNKENKEECLVCSNKLKCPFCPGTNYFYTGDIEESGHFSCEMEKVLNKVALIYKYQRGELYGK